MNTMLETLQARLEITLVDLIQWLTPNGITFMNTTTRVQPGFFTPETEIKSDGTCSMGEKDSLSDRKCKAHGKTDSEK